MKNRYQQITKMGGFPGIHKICSRCQLMNWKHEFQKRARSGGDGLQYVCRECRREERKNELRIIEKRMLKLVKKMNALSYSIHKM